MKQRFLSIVKRRPRRVLEKLTSSTYAAFVKESGIKLAGATNLNRKSGVA